MKGKQYDYKEAYNIKLTPKARFHYLENARHDQDAPTNMCSPNHYDSPAKQVGAVDPLAQQPFSPQAQANAQGVFGNQQMMQNAVNAPAMFNDQTGDGKITQADVIEARVEGYKK
jgi:hypothetical protein